MNCAGLKSKWQSFNKIISDISPAVFFLQETKLNSKQKFKIENPEYCIFRLERLKSGGGGLVIGALSDVKPILIREGDDISEALSIQIEINHMKIRCVVGYGACESDRQAKHLDITQKERRNKLWEYLDTEVIEAEQNNHGLIIQIDANAHVGCEIVNNDPNPQNDNGKVMEEFLKRNPALIVVNNLSLCNGLITRKRKTINNVEEAVLDFFIVNSQMLPFLVNMKVDEIDEYTLTNHAQNIKNNKSVKSDHRPLFLEMNLEFTSIKPQRVEQFNFKSDDCRQIFYVNTEVTTNLTKCFENDLPMHKQAKLWERQLENIFHKSFKKRRITNSNKKSHSKSA